MKKTLFLILLFSFCYLQGHATQNKAGFISYKHVTGLTYEASIVTYTQISSPVDRSSLTIKWGDGTTEVVTRTSQEVLEIDLKKNVYTKLHTYANHGMYIISMQDSTRTDNILNLNGGNSGGFPFYIESQLVIPAANDYNNSVELLNPPILTAKVGQIFSYTPSVYDEEGDILSFELASPKVNNSTYANGYQLITDVGPGANNQYYFNAKTGNIRWDSPVIAGLYNITIKISECRNSKIVGYTVVDYQIRVVSTLNSAFFDAISATPNDTIAPNDSIQISLGYKNAQADSVHLIAYSESLINGNTATFSLDSLSNNYLGKNFQWIPSISDSRCAPYMITIRGSAFLGNEKFSYDKTYCYYVRDATTTYCDTVCNGSTPINSIRKKPLISVQVAPNPFSNQTNIYILNNSDAAVYSFSLFDVWGQRVRYISSTTETAITINRKELPVGVYVYKIVSDSNKIATGKLIIVD